MLAKYRKLRMELIDRATRSGNREQYKYWMAHYLKLFNLCYEADSKACKL